ncbi:patatin-like phospholipase family protein [Roseibium sp.]|uniref:patatin-like phospholipase family protein n=1 Tax=Roseibium sp. TaxID=1936156 RepID=UPI003A98725A
MADEDYGRRGDGPDKASGNAPAVIGFDAVFREELASINRRRLKTARAQTAAAEGEISPEETPDPDASDTHTGSDAPAVKPVEPQATVAITVETTPDTAHDLVGLSLSGGGIRSAAFCFGVLQALDAKSKVLKRLDYLSTVSGGGYIGCSLAIGLKALGGRFPFPSELGKAENQFVAHIRNFSNYLFADRFLSVLGGVGAIVLGIFCNVLAVLPILILLAAATAAAFPTIGDLVGAYQKIGHWEFEGWVIGSLPISRVGLLVFSVLCCLAILFTWLEPVRSLQRRTAWRRGTGSICLLVLLLLAFELNLLLLGSLVKGVQGVGGATASVGENMLERYGSFLAVFSVVATLGRNLIERLREIGKKYETITAKLAKYSGNLVYLALALAVPVLLWIVYAWLYLALLQAGGSEIYRAIGFAVVGALVLFVLMSFVSANTFSLHSLYRDRLAKGFIHTFDENPDSAMAGMTRFSDLDSNDSPYLLVNSALNIQGSKTVNKRGRNADFFVFGPLFSGSRATGYCKTVQLEAKDEGLDVATGMAISGAAASANMGNKTISFLVFSLSLLNIRLGYWLANPGAVTCGADWQKRSRLRNWIGENLPLGPYWFFREARGNLTESCAKVYLSDGGHIENLGIYELLQRKCRVIIAVDAEADPQMDFPSFVQLQQYARIDQGLRIELKWSHIRHGTLSFGEGDAPEDAAHAALGIIHYDNKPLSDPTAQKGLLLYLKSSLSGDENDLVRDYKRRYPSFPHETTLDQLFSEEQFEVYRTLGFHVGSGACGGPAKIQGPGGDPWDEENAFVSKTLERCLGLSLDADKLM